MFAALATINLRNEFTLLNYFKIDNSQDCVQVINFFSVQFGYDMILTWTLEI
jgi:hypothetical protein